MTTAKMYVLAEAHRRRLLPLDLACWADVLSWVAVAEVRTILAWCQASPNTIAAYRDTYCLLLRFAHATTGKKPHRLDIADLDAPLIGAFLTHPETSRGVSVRTRNARLSAFRSLFGYAACSRPEHGALIQRVLAIPPKRYDQAPVTFLTVPEIDALLASPDRSTWIGRRDHALLVVAIQTGLRVSELVGLTCGDVELGTDAHVRCRGKGRRLRDVADQG